MWKPFRRFLQECPAVLASCAKTRRALWALEIVPGVIFLIGTSIASQFELPPPFQPFSEPLSQGFFVIFCVVSAVAFVRFCAALRMRYARARKQLYRQLGLGSASEQIEKRASRT
jgi:hypothetical protein